MLLVCELLNEPEIEPPPAKPNKRPPEPPMPTPATPTTPGALASAESVGAVQLVEPTNEATGALIDCAVVAGLWLLVVIALATSPRTILDTSTVEMTIAETTDTNIIRAIVMSCLFWSVALCI